MNYVTKCATPVTETADAVLDNAGRTVSTVLTKGLSFLLRVGYSAYDATKNAAIGVKDAVEQVGVENKGDIDQVVNDAKFVGQKAQELASNVGKEATKFVTKASIAGSEVVHKVQANFAKKPALTPEQQVQAVVAQVMTKEIAETVIADLKKEGTTVIALPSAEAK